MTVACPQCGYAPTAMNYAQRWVCSCGHTWQAKGEWTPSQAKAHNDRADQVELGLEIRRAELRLINAILCAHWNRGDPRSCARERYADAIERALDNAALLADLTGHTLGSKHAPK